MLSTPINKIILEGPDLSGKTTLYENIHKATGYKWNIQDRSALSMLVYAKLYERPEFVHVERLNEELNNLNNQIIILLPDWSVVLERFKRRGDELHDFVSLKKVYDLFYQAAEELTPLPNVTVVKSEVTNFVLSTIIDSLNTFENRSFVSMSGLCFLSAASSSTLEKVGLRFTSYDDCSFSDINKDDLNYDKEKEYYQKIETALTSKIKNELGGKNEYDSPESIDSRRFIYTSDTCISLAHFMFRDNILNAKYFLRSSNTKETLRYDLNFLKHLSKKAKESLKLPDSILIKLEVIVNSAHVRSNIKQD